MYSFYLGVHEMSMFCTGVHEMYLFCLGMHEMSLFYIGVLEMYMFCSGVHEMYMICSGVHGGHPERCGQSSSSPGPGTERSSGRRRDHCNAWPLVWTVNTALLDPCCEHWILQCWTSDVNNEHYCVGPLMWTMNTTVLDHWCKQWTLQPADVNISQFIEAGRKSRRIRSVKVPVHSPSPCHSQRSGSHFHRGYVTSSPHSIKNKTKQSHENVPFQETLTPTLTYTLSHLHPLT